MFRSSCAYNLVPDRGCRLCRVWDGLRSKENRSTLFVGTGLVAVELRREVLFTLERVSSHA